MRASVSWPNWPGVPIVMVDLNAAAQARFTRRDMAELSKAPTPIARFVAAIAALYIAFAERFCASGAAIHDALAVGRA